MLLCAASCFGKATYFLEQVTLEETAESVAVGVSELPLAVHLSILEGPLVPVALRPPVRTLTVDNVATEFSLVLTSIDEDGRTLAVLFVTEPGAFVLGHDAVFVPLAREQLQTVAMSDHFELLYALLLRQRLYLCLVGGCRRFDDLTVGLADEGHLAIVHAPVLGVSEALVVSLRVRRFLSFMERRSGIVGCFHVLRHIV